MAVGAEAFPAMVIVPAEVLFGELKTLQEKLEQIFSRLNSNNESTDKSWMTIQEVCKYMNISEASFHRKKNKPNFPIELCLDKGRTKRYRLKPASNGGVENF